MALGLWGRNLHIERVYGSGDPANLYVALMREAPGDLVTGGDLVEPTHASYQRVEIPNTTSGFSEASDGEVVNVQHIVWPQATGDWGTVRFWALTTASTGGQVVVWGFLGARVIFQGRRLRIPMGALVIRAQGSSEAQPDEWASDEVV